MINENGFFKEDFASLQEKLQKKTEKFAGEPMNFSSTSTQGFIVNACAYLFAILQNDMEALWLSNFVKTATGIYLDRLVANRGIKRLPATSTQVRCLCVGDPETLINQGSFVGERGSDIFLESRRDFVLTHSKCYQVYLSMITLEQGDSLSFIINDRVVNYSLKSSETLESITTEIQNLFRLNTIEASCSLKSELIIIQANQYDNTIVFINNSPLVWQVEKIGGILSFFAQETGVLFIPADSINDIKTPLTGWDSVSNPLGGITGREQETDQELRKRFATATIQGLATDLAIENQVKQVAGVTTVKCISNRENFEDELGRPPHSFEVIVIGGEDKAIAQTIYNSQPAGIYSFGNREIDLNISYAGDNKLGLVRFSRPENVYIAVSLIIFPYTEESGLPENYEFLLKQSLLKWSLSEFSIGKDVIRERLYVPIYGAFTGMGTVEVKIGIAENSVVFPDVKEENIEITNRQIATMVSDLIRVQLL